MRSADHHLVRVGLGNRGTTWVRRTLENGGGLASAILRKTRPESGAVYGFYPENRSAIDLTEFDESVFSVLAPRDADAVGTAAADAAIELARSTGGNVFITETYIRRDGFEPGMTWGEGTIRIEPQRVLFHGSQVLVWRTLEEASTDEVGWLIGDVGVMAKIAGGARYPPLSELTVPDLEMVAEGVRAVLVGAYDGVSLLVWLSSPIR
ncbi:MAG: hypothetical protein M3P38_02715 [Chloroflexota bacterium]|nr:hypothetical protein [Chloroflexota bacterium]